MNRLIALVAAVIVGSGAAVAVAYSVVNGATAAPTVNPAAGQIVQYGDR